MWTGKRFSLPGATAQIAILGRGSFAFGEAAKPCGFCAAYRPGADVFSGNWALPAQNIRISAADAAVLPVENRPAVADLEKIFQPIAGNGFAGGAAYLFDKLKRAKASLPALALRRFESLCHRHCGASAQRRKRRSVRDFSTMCSSSFASLTFRTPPSGHSGGPRHTGFSPLVDEHSRRMTARAVHIVLPFRTVAATAGTRANILQSVILAPPFAARKAQGPALAVFPVGACIPVNIFHARAFEPRTAAQGEESV